MTIKPYKPPHISEINLQNLYGTFYDISANNITMSLGVGWQ